MAAKDNKKIFIAPGEGAHLPVLDIIHKITADRSSGSLTVEEWGLPPGMIIPRTPTPARTSATSCWKAN